MKGPRHQSLCVSDEDWRLLQKSRPGCLSPSAPLTLKLGSLSCCLPTDLPRVAVFHCSLTLPARLAAGWAPACTPLTQPSCSEGYRAHPSGQGNRGQLVNGPSPSCKKRVRHGHPAVCKCPMYHTRDKTPGWGEIISASLLQEVRTARAAK